MGAFGAKVRLTLDKSGRGQFYTEIQNAANRKPIQIKNVIIDEKTKSGLSRQLSDLIKQNPIKIDSIEIKRIDASKAVADLRRQLTNMLSGLSITGVKDFVGGGKAGVAGTNSGAAGAITSKMQELTTMKSSLESLYSSLEKRSGLDGYSQTLEKMLSLYKQIDAAAARISIVGEQKTDIRNIREMSAALEKEVKDLLASGEAAKKAASDKQEAAKKSAKALTDEEKAAKKMNAELLAPGKNATKSKYTSLLKKDSKQDADEMKRLTEEYNKYIKAVTELEGKTTPADAKEISALNEQGAAIRSNIDALEQSAAAHEKHAAAQEKDAAQATMVAKRVANLQRSITQQFRTIPGLEDSEYGGQLKKIKEALSGEDIDLSKLKELEAEVARIKQRYTEAGYAGSGFFNTLSAGLKNIAGFTAMVASVRKAISVIRQMVSAVKEVDAAMTELRKVTDLTATGYKNFYKDAAASSKKIGATVSDTINATADFARLGYEPGEALELAKAALTYKNVGDGIENVSQATESLISTIKAYRLEASDAMMVIDEFNEVGNRFAISSTGIGDALVRSASALQGAGNSLEESIGLITAANAIVQNPESVGTALKTLTMYLRAAKPDLEAMGEDAEGCANSVSELRTKLVALTGVDIMKNAREFKSTYQILEEIAKVWDKIADVDKAAVTKLIGGKRNANVIQALLTNFGDAQSVVKVAMDATGSATRENEEYLDSIAGKLDLLKGKFQDLSESVIGSDIIKIGTDFLGVLTDIGSELAKLPSWFTLPAATVAILSEFMSVFKALPGVVKAAFKALSPAAIGANLLNPFSIIITSAAAVIGIIASVTAAEKKRRDAAIEAANASAKEFSDSTKAYNDSIGKLNDLKQRYNELAVGVDDQGKNVSLTASEYNEFKNILEQIVDISPNIVRGYNDERVAILNYRDAINEAKQSLHDMHAEELTSYFSERESNKRLSGWMDSRESAEKIFQEQNSHILSEMVVNATVDLGLEDQLKVMTAIIDKAEELGDIEKVPADTARSAAKTYALVPGARSIYGTDLSNAIYLHSADAIRNVYEHASDYLGVLQAISDESGKPLINLNGLRDASSTLDNLSSGERDISESTRQLTADMQIYLEQYNNSTQQIAKAPWRDMFYDQLSGMIDDLQDAEEEISYKEIKTMSERLYAEVNAAMSSEPVQSIANMASELDGSREDITEYNAAVAEFTATWTGSKEALSVVSSWLSGLGEVQISAEDSAAGFSAAAKRLADGYKIIDKAKSEMQDGGSLSAETITDISNVLTSTERLADYVYEENGAIKLNIELWAERSKAIAENDLKLKQDRLDSLQREIDRYERSTSVTDAELVERYKAEKQQVQDEILSYRAILANQSKDEFGLKAMAADIDAVSSSAANMIAAIEKVKKGTALTAKEKLGLESEYPSLMEFSGWANADTAEEQASALEQVYLTYQERYQSIIQTALDGLKDLKAKAVEEGADAETLSVFDVIIENITARYGEIDLEELVNPSQFDSLTDALKRTDEYIELVKESADGFDLDILRQLRDLFGEDWETYAIFDEAGTPIDINREKILELITTELDLEGENASLAASIEAVWAAALKGEDAKKPFESMRDAISKARSAANIAQKYRENGMSLDIWEDLYGAYGKDAGRYIDDNGNLKIGTMGVELLADLIKQGAPSDVVNEWVTEWQEFAYGATQAVRSLDGLSDAIGRYTNVSSMITDLGKGGTETVDTLNSILELAKDGKIAIGDLMSEDGTIDPTRAIARLKEYRNSILSFDNLKGIEGMTEDIAASIRDYVDSATDAEIATQALSDALSSVSTAQGLLADVRSGEGDFASMLETVSGMAQQSGQSIYDFFTIVGDKIIWNEDAITEWATNYLDYLEQAGTVTHAVRVEIEKILTSQDVLNKQFMDRESAGMDNVLGAIKSAVAEVGLSTDQITQLEKRYQDLPGFTSSELFEKTAIGIRLNTDALREYESAYEDMRMEQTAKDVERLTAEYESLTEQINDTADIEKQIALLDQRDTVGERIERLKMLQSQYAALNSSYNKWKQAQSMGEEGDMYDDIAGSLKDIKELYDKGLIGTNKFRAAVQMMTDQDLSGLSAYDLTAIYDEAYPKMQRYFKDGEDGVKTFLEDVKALGKGWATVDDQGWWTLDFNAEELAKELGVSTELVEIMARKLKDFGFDIDLTGFGSGLDKYVTNVDDGLEEIRSSLDELEESFSRGDITLDEYLQRYEALTGAKKALEGISAETEPKVDTMSIEEATEKIDDMSSMINALTKDGVKIPVSFTGAVEEVTTKLSEWKETIDEINKSSGNVEETISQIKDGTDELASETVEPEIGIDTGTVDVEIDDVRDKLDNLDVATANPAVVADVGQADDKLSHVAEELSTLDNNNTKIEVGVENIDATPVVDLQTAPLDTLSDKLEELRNKPKIEVEIGISLSGDDNVIGKLFGSGLAASKNTDGSFSVKTPLDIAADVVKNSVATTGKTPSISSVESMMEEMVRSGQAYVDGALDAWDTVSRAAALAVENYVNEKWAVGYADNSGDMMPTAEYDREIREIENVAKGAVETRENAEKALTEFFGKNGTLDLLNRPLISSQMLRDVGWDVEGNGTATVFSSGYRIGENGEIGLIVTPILPDGDPLSPDTLTEAIENIVVGPNGELSFERDDMGFDLSDILIDSLDLSAIQEHLRDPLMEAWADALHLAQEEYYGLDNIEADADVELEVENPDEITDTVEEAVEDADAEVKVDADTTELEQSISEKTNVSPISITTQTIMDAGTGVNTISAIAASANVDTEAIARLNQAYMQLQAAMDEASSTDPVDTEAVNAAASNLQGAASEFTSAFADLGDKLSASGIDVGSIEIDADVNKALATIAAMSVPEAKVEFSPDTGAIDAYHPSDKSADVNYRADFTQVVTATVPTLNGIIKYQRQIIGGSTATTQAGGTASARGTAYRKGVNRTHGKGNALGGEVGTELVVRDGHWFTIGDDGAEFFEYQDGDIIFNASQTEELLKKGKISLGGGRGVVIGDDSAYAEGTAFAASSFFSKFVNPDGDHVGGGGKLTNGKSSDSSSKGKKSSKKSKDDAANDAKDLFDWIEVAIARVERVISNFSRTASSAFKNLATRLTATNDQISNIYREIEIQQQGAARYMQQAESVGLSDDLKERVRNGAIDINDYDDATKELISDYKNWHDKSLACSDAVAELHENLAELYSGRMDTIQKNFEDRLGEITHQLNVFNNQLDASEYSGITKPFDAMIDATSQSISLQRQELASLQEAMNVAMSMPDGIAEGSEKWYEMRQKIHDVTEAIQEAEIEVAKLYQDKFDAVADEFSDKMSLIDNALTSFNDAASEADYTGATKRFVDMISVQRQGIGILQNELGSLEQRMQEAMSAPNGIKEGSAAWYDMQSTINSVKKSIVDAGLEIRKVYKDIFDDIETRFQDQIAMIEHELDEVNDRISSSEYTGAVKPFEKVVEDQHKNIAVLNSELASLQEAMQNAMSAPDGIKEGSHEWYEMVNGIEAVKSSIRSARAEISKAYTDSFDDIKREFDSALSMSGDIIDFSEKINEASDYTGQAKMFADMVDVQRTTVGTLEKELTLLQDNLQIALDAGAIEEYSDAWYEMQSDINDVRISIEDALIDIAKTYQESFDDIKSRFETIDDMSSRLGNIYDKMKSLSEFNGAAKPFALIGDKARDDMERYEDELGALERAMKEAVDSGAIVEGSDAWHEMGDAILSVKEKIMDAGAEIARVYQEAFEEIQSGYNNVNSIITHGLNMLNNAVSETTYTGDAKPFMQMIEIRRQNLAMLEDELEGLRESMSIAVDSGEITEGSDAWYKMQQSIWGVEEAAQQASTEIRKLYMDIFNDVEQRYGRAMSLIDSAQQYIKSGLDEIEARGYLGGKELYAEMANIEQKNIDMQRRELQALEQAMADALSTGEIEEGSEAWYDMQSSIIGVKKSIREANIELLNYGNSIRQINWDIFDKTQERISRITDEAEFLIKLMDSSQLFDERGQATGTGRSAIGLHAMEYDVYMKQADKYADEMEKLNAEIANDSYNYDLISRRDELLEKQRESILAAEQEKEAIADLVKQGIDKEIDSLSELISTYEENLDRAKDLYDYQRNIEDQTKNIASLQKQLSAYQGDTSEENRARIQRITVDLSEAMRDLQETEYDRYITDQKMILDDMLDEYSRLLNSRLDNIDLLTNDMIDMTNLRASEIRDAITMETSVVGTALSDEMAAIWNNGGETRMVVSKYADDTILQMGALGEEIRGVANNQFLQTTTLGGAIDGVTAGVLELYNHTTDISTNLLAAEGLTSAAVNGAGGSITGAIGSGVTTLGSALESVNTEVGSGVTTLGSALESINTEGGVINESVGREAGNIIGAITSVSEDQKANVEAQNSELASWTQDLTENSNTAIGTAYDLAVDTAAGLVEQIGVEQDTLSEAIDGATSMLSIGGQGYGDYVEQRDREAKATVEDMKNKLGDINANAGNYGTAINENLANVTTVMGGISGQLETISKNQQATAEAVAAAAKVDIPEVEPTPVVVESPPVVVEPMPTPEVTVAVDNVQVDVAPEETTSSSKSKSKKKKSSSGSTPTAATKIGGVGVILNQAKANASGKSAKRISETAKKLSVISKITGNADGGYIADLQKIAYANGDDMITINTLKKGEAVLTPEQARLFSIFTSHLPELNNITETFTKIETMKELNNAGANRGDVNVGGITVQIPIEHVSDYNDFVRQLRDDKTFERMIKSITIEPLMGGSGLAKKKYYN